MSSSTQNNFAPEGGGGAGTKQSQPAGKPPQAQQSASNKPVGANQSPNIGNSGNAGAISKSPSTLNAAGASIADVQKNGNSTNPNQNNGGQARNQEQPQKLATISKNESQAGIRPGSQGQGRIQSNSNIMSGGKPTLQIPGLSGSGKQEPSNRSIDKKQQIAAVLGNLANEDFFNQQNEILGTQNDSPENSVLLSPQVMHSNELKPKTQVTKNPTQPSGRYNNVGLGNQHSRLPSANSNAGGKLSGRNKVSPMPPQVPKIDEKKMPFGGMGAVGPRDYQLSAKGNNGATTQNPKNPLLDNSHHQEPKSLRSSFDYADIDLNNAMSVIGKPTITGRGQKFVSVKHFKEDNWSDDESVYVKQMKMPNVHTNKIQYQKEIGINLNPVVHSHHVAVDDGKLHDSLDEIKKMMPEPNFYKIVNKDRIHIIEDYHDRCPLLGLRKEIMKARVYCNRGAQLIMQNSLFESISISVIVVNSIFLAMDDPLRDPSETPKFMLVADDIFQYLYTIEMVVKIVSLGFICNDGSYLRDAWNILDFVIIASGYMGMFLQGSGVNLSALRSFRVIRPLRTISSVAGLRVIVSSLINAMPLLRDSLLVLMFFFLVFAIAGCQLFTGALKNRCFLEETGVIDTDYTQFCGGGNSCRPGYYCAKSNENPANGATNFDNITFALLQVFQVVSMEGWTAIMVALMQSVGTWIVVYFYPIIFIGAFFLLNLTLAVIKAKFTEEMSMKQENAGPPKKKKLDDAPLSSEDEDAKALEIKARIEGINEAKNMSPRTKQNEIEKIRIGQMIKRIDRAFIKREVEHKIVEKEDEEELIHKSPNKSQFQKKTLLHQSRKLDAADKISILNPSKKVQMATPAASIKGTLKPIPENLNYSEVFYSNKRTVLTLGNAHPGKELMDLFVANQQDQMSKTGTNFGRKNGGNFMLGNLDGEAIAEDEEEQHIEVEEINRKRKVPVRGAPQRGGNMSDIEEAARQQKKMSQTTHGPEKWMGKMFEIRQPQNMVNDGNAEKDKRLVFAGITNQNMKPAGQNLDTSLRTTAKRFFPEQQAREENAKREIYENITKNFDIFEFLEDENNANSQPVVNKQSIGTTPATYGLQPEDDGMSDDLEFHIQELDRKVEAMLYQDHNGGGSSGTFTNPQVEDLDRLNNIVSREGMRQETEDGEQKNNTQLKRGSTQATYDGVLGAASKSPLEMSEYKYVSPFMQNLRKSQQKDKTVKKKKYPKKDRYPDLVYRGNTKGLVGLFRACKKIQLVQRGRDFKEEYIMIRKRARSLVNKPPYMDENQEPDENAEEIMNLTQKSEKSAPNAQPTIRAKSIETKRKQMLAHSIKFQKRINLMRKRRAQYFAPEIKLLDADHEAIDKAYEEYVMQRRKIKVNPVLMDEPLLRKRILYRSASSDPILRHNEYLDMKNALGLPGKKNKELHIFDLHGMQQEEGGSLLDIETQRSEILDKDYIRVVLNQEVKQKEFEKFHENEFVPHMEDIMQDKELKIVIKMTNMRFGSINDIFEKSGPGRFMTDREKFLLEQEKKKKEALKLKLPVRVPPKDIILGYQKKLHFVPKSFHENLLRTEFVPSDEDQDGMLSRIEDQFNYNHRSHIYNTGTISVVVQKPHNDNKIMNWNYFANIQALERDAKYEQEMILIEEEKLAKEAQRKKPGIMLYDNEKIDHKAWRTQLPSYTINPNSMKLYNTSQYVYSKTFKDENSMNNSQSEKHFDVIHPPLRPEPLTDKQILTYMNFDCKRSTIFNQINIAKYPTKIYKREIPTDGKGIKVRKKVKDEDVKEIEASDEEIEEKKSRKIDYFLDRKFEGAYHIDIAKNQVFKRPRDWFEWSGQDVLSKFDPYKVKLAIGMLDPIRVWPYAFHGYVKKWRIVLRKIMNGPLVEHGMTVCVLGNTVVLSLDYYGASETIQAICAVANTFFTLIFAIEMFSRIIAIGAPKWLADKMNYMDGTIVMLSLVEMIFMSGGGALSALRAVRIFRVFRVLRVARLLRGLKSMMQIINVIQRSISSFIYLAMLLMLFIFIYALLGMQVFGGAFKDPEVVGTVRYNYDSFISAFITAFILLTTENWNSVMFYAFSGDTSQALIAIYFVSCIFIGNWMLLNLFLAILLDSFSQVEEEDMMTPEKRERIRLNMLEELKIKEGEDFIEGMQELHVWSFNVSTEKKEKKKKKKKKKTQEEIEAEKQPTGNILEESQEVDLNELAKRDQKALAERQKLFRNIECQNSCYLLSQQNWFRILCYKIVHHGKFESFIMLLIVGSSFKLVFDTYTDRLPADDPITIYSSKVDLVFQVFFTLEMLLKIISFGFVMDDNSYLSESWSQMDFFIVTTGLIDTSLEGVDIAFLKVLRLLRILRPLRFLSHSSSMKTLIEALMASIPSIMNVGVVIVIVFLMFAILGVNLFAGKLQSCTVGFYKINTMEECFKVRGKWVTFDQHMDNAMRAMITLFVVSNNEGWPDVMYAYGDATGVETGPKPGAGMSNCFFFVGFVFVGSFFFLNLFTGVLFLNFEKAQRDEADAMLLDGDEVKWVDMMKMICDEQPEIIKIPKNPIRKWAFDFTRDEGPFANFIMACIILNIFTMAATFEGQSDSYSNILEKINYFFTAAFTMECASKLIAHAGHYFNSAWNKFDFFVVSASFLDIVMANMSANSLKVIRVGPQLARIMRVMRVSRLFKLLNKYKGLQALMSTITFSLPSVINAFALLALVYFIFSVLGVFFFKDVTQGDQLDDYMNFKDFTQSLIMMLRLSTGEDWPVVMYDLQNTDVDCIPGVNCGTGYAPLFFIMFVLIQQYIMVDLFVLIILQQFDLYYLPTDNVLDRFKTDVNSFKITWKKFSKDFDGFKIRGNDVQKFFKELKGDLGMSMIKDKKTVERELVIMNLQADADGFIYFNELLYKTMKRRYANGRTKKKVLYELELDTLEKLEKIMKVQMLLSRAKERKNAVAVNPFLAMMYKNMSFSVWRNIYVANLPKRIAHMQLGLEREISEEEEEVVEEGDPDYEYVTEDYEVVEEVQEEMQPQNPMMDEEESPFAFHEGGSRDNVGIPRNRFTSQDGKVRRRRFSSSSNRENYEKDEVA